MSEKTVNNFSILIIGVWIKTDKISFSDGGAFFMTKHL